MLTEIKVNNFAIIDSLAIQFKAGFNVLSGETGSGKSVVLRSLSLLMGEKSTADYIQNEKTQAVVEGAFDLSGRPDIVSALHEAGIECPDDSLVVRRIISRDGKNRVYVNGALAHLNQLREIVSPLVEVAGHSPLIEMTGQHDNRYLQSRLYHLELLDQYLGLTADRVSVGEIFARRNQVQSELAAAQKSAQEKAQRQDFLRFQKDEIEALKLQPGDVQLIENQVELLRKSDRWQSFLDGTESELYSQEDSILVRIHKILAQAQEFQELHPKISIWAKSLAEAKTVLENSVYDLRDLGRDFGDGRTGSLEEWESKLSDLRRVQKKFGSDEGLIFRSLDEIRTELVQLENSDAHVAELEKQLAQLNLAYSAKANDLHKKRVTGLKALRQSVQEELKDLNMKGLLFDIRTETLPEPSASGVTTVEFTIQSGEKDQPRPLAKFASGGELSRILLALKRVVGQSDKPRTYLFDEVDAGVSGVTAEKVGRKLKSISKSGQVICVTHLPQVAAFADCHFVIQKSSRGGSVKMAVHEMRSDERIEEIARMISGEKITRTSLEHARGLIADVAEPQAPEASRRRARP
jgi:DNA repair protein RecN (Recombination protein N)